MYACVCVCTRNNQRVFALCLFFFMDCKSLKLLENWAYWRRRKWAWPLGIHSNNLVIIVNDDIPPWVRDAWCMKVLCKQHTFQNQTDFSTTFSAIQNTKTFVSFSSSFTSFRFLCYIFSYSRSFLNKSTLFSQSCCSPSHWNFIKMFHIAGV